VVLAAVTHALDLNDPENQHMVLRTLATVDEDRRRTYTHFIRSAASDAARRALEDLMTRTFKDDFIEAFEAKGRAKGRAEGEARGEARLLLRQLEARGIAVTDDARKRITGCTDMEQLETWGIRLFSARTLAELFDE
jgi:hypothetical protein